MNTLFKIIVGFFAIAGLFFLLNSLNSEINTYDGKQKRSFTAERPTQNDLERDDPTSYISIFDLDLYRDGITRRVKVSGYLETTAYYHSYSSIVLETQYLDGNKSIVGTERNTIHSRLYRGRRIPFEFRHKLPRRTDTYTVKIIDAEAIAN